MSNKKKNSKDFKAVRIHEFCGTEVKVKYICPDCGVDVEDYETEVKYVRIHRVKRVAKG